MAAENAEIEPGDTVAVWGCGPVAQMAIQSCWMLGAGRVIAIDRVPERLDMAGTHGKAETINFDKEEVYERLNAMTQGRGPDRCIDAVGCEAHGTGGDRRRSGQCEGRRQARYRSGACYSASNLLLPQRGYGLSARGLCWADR
jgi:threonine dehydrogenase-like Zn-dependent dehydrogenase